MDFVLLMSRRMQNNFANKRVGIDGNNTFYLNLQNLNWRKIYAIEAFLKEI